jgi:hypothetical protein
MIATIAQLTGAALLSIGVGLIFPPAGIIIAGVLILLFGISLENK